MYVVLRGLSYSNWRGDEQTEKLGARSVQTMDSTRSASCETLLKELDKKMLPSFLLRHGINVERERFLSIRYILTQGCHGQGKISGK